MDDFWRLLVAELSAGLPFDKIKIDRAFVCQSRQTRNRPTSCARSSISAMAWSSIVAEGVETEQLSFLAQEGCGGPGLSARKPAPIAYAARRATAPWSPRARPGRAFSSEVGTVSVKKARQSKVQSFGSDFNQNRKCSRDDGRRSISLPKRCVWRTSILQF
jgi:hypothetical protein